MTLRVADEEIAKDYIKMRAKQFNKHLWPIFVISSLYFVIRLVQYFTDQETPTVRVFSALFNVAICLIWFLFARFAPLRAPIVCYIWLLAQCVLTNLSLRDLMPEVMLESEKSSDEVKYLLP
jgi:uncharacterized membrane protein YhhN